MSATSEARTELRNAIDQAAGSDMVTVKKETLAAVIGSPSQATTDQIYRYLIPGLLILAGLALVGMFFLMADGNEKTPPDLLLTAFTATMTGLLGLFAKSPTA